MLTMSPDAGSISWMSRSEFERHYRKHRQEVGARSREAYFQSARQTIQVGTRFTYAWKGGTRVGYVHRATRRFTALADDEQSILTHFAASERRVRGWRGSTYN